MWVYDPFISYHLGMVEIPPKACMMEGIQEKWDDEWDFIGFHMS